MIMIIDIIKKRHAITLQITGSWNRPIADHQDTKNKCGVRHPQQWPLPFSHFLDASQVRISLSRYSSEELQWLKINCDIRR